MQSLFKSQKEEISCDHCNHYHYPKNFMLEVT